VDNPATLRGGLDSITVGGATPTGDALQKAVEFLHAAPEERSKRIKKVILVTDANSNVGPKPQEILDANFVRRAIVDVVSIGGGADAKTFEALTSKTGGKFVVVNDTGSLARALDPRIPYSEGGAPIPLLAEAERVSTVLKSTDKAAPSYSGLAAAAEAVRQRMAQKLQEVVSLEGQARGDLDMVVSAATSDPKWPKMSMREFADRVWSRGADLARLQGLEASYRRGMKGIQS
jgi:von Willebrand factor type A domain